MQFSLKQVLVVVMVCAVALAVIVPMLPRSWTANYDRVRYNKIVRAIETDPQHLVGKRLDVAAKELNLKDVPWNDFVILQEPSGGRHRVYHFRGFALCFALESLPPGITLNSTQPYSCSDDELDRHGVLWIANWPPMVGIDGISDRDERMKRLREAIPQPLERDNATPKPGEKESGKRVGVVEAARDPK